MACKLESPIEQHGHTTPGVACAACAAPSLSIEEGTSLRTAGGDVLFVAHNVGGGGPGLVAKWDGAPVKADFVKVSDRTIAGGLRLRVSVPPGVGRHTLSIKRGSTAVSVRVAYAPPTLLRVAALPSRGGAVTLLGETQRGGRGGRA